MCIIASASPESLTIKRQNTRKVSVLTKKRISIQMFIDKFHTSLYNESIVFWMISFRM